MVPRPLDRSGVEAQGEAGGEHNLTRTLGGVSGKQRGGCQAPPFHLSLSLFGFVVLDRPTRTAPAERDVTGAIPPFVPLARHGEAGGVSHGVRHRVRPFPPPVGSLPSVCIPAGRLPGRASGPDNDARRARPIDGAPCGRRSSGIVMDFRP